MDGLNQPLPVGPRASREAPPRRWLGRRRSETIVQVGLQFLGDRLIVARLRHNAGRVEIQALRALAAPAAQRAHVLRALKQEGLFRKARIHLVLAPGQYDVQQAPAPAVPAEEMHDALRWQLRASLGYPPEEALLDFATLPQPADAPSTKLLVVTARRSVVADAVAPLAACGLSAEAVDAPEFAQRNLARAGLPLPADTHAWLAFDQDTFLLTVHCLGEVAFARRMLLPNAALTGESDTDPAAHFVERVVLQVQRSLDLFERQSGLPPVTQIAIGPHPQAPAVAAELGEKAAVRTWLAESAEPLLRAAAAIGQATVAGELTAALGAAMRALPGADGEAPSVQSIDLYRSERTVTRDASPRLPALVAVVTVVFGLGAHYWLEAQSLRLHRDTAAHLRSDVQRAEKMLLALGAQAPAQASARAGEQNEVAALEALAAKLGEGVAGRNEPFTEPLRAFARARAEGVWLTGVRIANSNTQLQLEGKAVDASRVPQWLAALKREPGFAGKAFARIEMQPAREPEGAVQFRIATDLPADAGGAAR